MRIAGSDADAVLRRLGVAALPKPRRATLALLADPTDGRPIDRVLLLRFPGPGSFSGDDIVEIHHHGGVGIRRMLGAVLARVPELRPAEPGEFTRRAFLNGKLDLAEVEGLGDLIDATTARAARQALLRLDGGLSRRVADWSERLLAIRTEIEADLDFSADQADVAAGAVARSAEALAAIGAEFAQIRARSPAAARLQQGCVVAIVGPPNVGKSSLVNLLAGRDVAIVTERPGTTRDPIEVALDLDGLPVTLVDTAGLRETDDLVEREGIRRACERSDAADLVVELVDARVAPAAGPIDPRRLVVANKADLAPCSSGLMAISCRTGAGIDRLLRRIAELLDTEAADELAAVPADARAEAAIAAAGDAIAAALAVIPLGEPILVAEEVQRATSALARITGTDDDPEELLGRIFARFCIGK